MPQLAVTTSPLLYELEAHFLQQQVTIEGWLRKQWRLTPPPIYASVDLRNAGFKLAPVDTNLFPAGFNNLNPDFLSLYIQVAQSALEQTMPGCQRVLIVPESHNRNPYYFESIAMLQTILMTAGFDVRIGTLQEGLEKNQLVKLASGHTLLLEPLQRNGNRLHVSDFSPCFILLNNDLSNGIPAIFEGIEQLIVPPVQLGWATRFKSTHFHYYSEVATEFARLIDIDPWLIDSLFYRCGPVNFLKREGETELAAHTEKLLQQIQKKYDDYGIKQKPYAVIKADAGTYGQGVLMVHSAEEILLFNRKKRSEMAMAKGSRPIRQVIVQEGVYTFENWQNAVAEPVIYMFGQNVMGGFYRVHTGRGISDNLNAPGMQFVPLSFQETCNKPMRAEKPDACPNRFYVYGVVARLALVAAAREQNKVVKP
jgi:glutamate--cysteine ligase